MTKQDFERIAAVFAKHAPEEPPLLFSEEQRADITRELIAEDMADALALTNPRFNRSHFLAACKVTTPTKPA